MGTTKKIVMHARFGLCEQVSRHCSPPLQPRVVLRPILAGQAVRVNAEYGGDTMVEWEHLLVRPDSNRPGATRLLSTLEDRVPGVAWTRASWNPDSDTVSIIGYFAVNGEMAWVNVPVSMRYLYEDPPVVEVIVYSVIRSIGQLVADYLTGGSDEQPE